ncbi:MAG TPA: hypothetical protein VGD67_23535, partial [Pseudonocardiaceae bacterium]
MSRTLTGEEADAALAGAGAFCDALAEKLVTLDGHQGQRLLDAAALTDDGARRWAAARAGIAALWTNFATYRDTLELAREVRGAGRADRLGEDERRRLTTLLRDPVATLDDRPATLDDLARRLEADHAAVLP